MVVTEVLLLSLIESIKSMIPFSLVPDPVLAHIVRNAKAGDAENNELGCEIDGMPDWIPWSVSDEISPPICDQRMFSPEKGALT